jgi:hypothetical protein
MAEFEVDLADLRSKVVASPPSKQPGNNTIYQ